MSNLTCACLSYVGNVCGERVLFAVRMRAVTGQTGRGISIAVGG